MVPRPPKFHFSAVALLGCWLGLTAGPSLHAQFVLSDPAKSLPVIEFSEPLLALTLPTFWNEDPLELEAVVLSPTTLIGTTGNLGITVTDGQTPLELTVNTPIVAPGVPLIVSITYGLWNSPAVNVTASINGVSLGSFTAENGFASPGPSTVQFSTTGSVLIAANLMLFLGDTTGDYVVSRVEIHAVPEPSTWALLGAGLGWVVFLVRRRRA